jgi:hypothetical protein
MDDDGTLFSSLYSLSGLSKKLVIEAFREGGGKVVPGCFKQWSNINFLILTGIGIQKYFFIRNQKLQTKYWLTGGFQVVRRRGGCFLRQLL